jgi:hypothetical protein
LPLSGSILVYQTQKVLYRWRLFDNFLVAVDGTGMLTFGERHCPFCLT